MRARRSKDQIVVEILSMCERGENITRIVYQTNTNFAIVRAYLTLLMKNYLLECQESYPKIYKTTAKGIELRDRLGGLHKLIGEMKI